MAALPNRRSIGVRAIFRDEYLEWLNCTTATGQLRPIRECRFTPIVHAALTIAFNSIGTVPNGLDVFSCAFDCVASGQNQYRAAKCENCQKLFHSLSPTARANSLPLETTACRNDCSVASAHDSRSVQNDR